MITGLGLGVITIPTPALSATYFLSCRYFALQMWYVCITLHGLDVITTAVIWERERNGNTNWTLHSTWRWTLYFVLHVITTTDQNCCMNCTATKNLNIVSRLYHDKQLILLYVKFLLFHKQLPTILTTLWWFQNNTIINLASNQQKSGFRKEWRKKEQQTSRLQDRDRNVSMIPFSSIYTYSELKKSNEIPDFSGL